MIDPQHAARFSLLWPSGRAEASKRFCTCDAAAVADLGLDQLARTLTISPRYTEPVRTILLTLCDDPDVIRYRQEVLRDLYNHPDLCVCFQSILGQLAELGRMGAPEWRGQTALHEALWRLGELELYVEALRKVQSALRGAGVGIQSQALQTLNRLVDEAAADPSFIALEQELPKLRKEIEGVRSITIGVNLDPMLRPVAATLLTVNREPFTEGTLLGRLLGKRGDQVGITTLHRVLPKGGASPDTSGAVIQPLMHPLFRDLHNVIQETAKPIAEALAAYMAIDASLLAGLEPELAFYLGSVQLLRTLADAGLPFAYPEVCPGTQREGTIRGLYNINLALHLVDQRGAVDLTAEIVPNDLTFGPAGRIFILTGPNRGGKTTYTQGVGLAQAMFQAGLAVPGIEACLSPVDAIYTHFPTAEKFSLEMGRLGEEAKRLNAIFHHATCHSLVLLNESLFSTSPGESLYLARDIVRGLRLLGARAIYATHLHELGTNLEALNAEVAGNSLIVSLVAEVETDAGVRRTFRIRPGKPLGMSYAREIAAHYGISYEKLAEGLRERKLI